MSDSMNPIADRIRAALASRDGGNSNGMTTAGEGWKPREWDAARAAVKPWVADVLRALAESRRPETDGGAPDGDFTFDDVFEDEGEGDLSEFHGSASSLSSDDFS